MTSLTSLPGGLRIRTSFVPLLAILVSANLAHGQDCLDDYITNSNLAFAQEIPGSPAWSTDPYSGGVYQTVEGGGTALAIRLFELSDEAAFGGGPLNWIVRVEPLQTGQTPYAAFTVDMSVFSAGLTLYSQAGPDSVRIDAAGSGSAIDVLGGTGSLRIGYALGRETSDWLGFDLTGGGADRSGGGIRVVNQTGLLQIAGNNVHHNASAQSGGGMFLRDCSDSLVALNYVDSNSTGHFGVGVIGVYDSGLPIRGAGIYQNRGSATYIGNNFQNNTFGMDTWGDPAIDEPARQGGGLAVAQLAGILATDTTVCANRFEGNLASEGGGFWSELFVQSLSSELELEFNLFESNGSWAPTDDPASLSQTIQGSYRGAGLCISGSSAKIGGKLAGAKTLRVAISNNRLMDNTIANPGFLTSGPDSVGGGMYTEVARNDSSDSISLVGNAVWSNSSTSHGAGMYVDHQVSNGATQSGEIFHNTSVSNNIAGSGFGAGIFLTSATRFDGSSNVFFHNTINLVAAAAGGDWYGEFGLADFFRYGQMPSYSGAGANLFGFQCDNALPLLNAGDWHLQGNLSPCIDSADPTIALPLALLNITKDADGGDRVVERLGMGALRDRGADEHLAFLRGDANADGCLNIADAIFMNNALFVPGSSWPVCLDAADANDDGSFNIADTIHLLAVIFPNGSGPPPTTVGVCFSEDPTPDALPTGSGTPCVCP